MDGDINENLKIIMHNIAQAAQYRPSGDIVRLMAVTKTVPVARVNEAVRAGVKLLGENRIQEFTQKKDFYDTSAEIHFIGHLQTNKVKYAVGNVSLIQSVGSIKLAAEIDRVSKTKNVTTDILLEVNVGEEETKSGVLPDELFELAFEINELKNVKIRGLMAIPPPFESEVYFDKMNGLFTDLKEKRFCMDILSMGMSDDYTEAIKHGSNLVRIGSALFGARTY